MSTSRDARTLRRLWALREDVAVESDDDGVVLLAPWGEIDLGARGLRVEDELRRLAFGPIDIDNLEPGPRDELTTILAEVPGAVVHSLKLAGRHRAGLSVVPVAAWAPFSPRPADPLSVVRLSRLTVIRPWAGSLMIGRPGAPHEVVCEGPVLGALLARLATSRQVSDLSGQSPIGDLDVEPNLDDATPRDVEDLVGWLVAAGVVAVRRMDGRYDEDVDEDLVGWSAHELEFDTRTRRPGQAVEERFRLQEDARSAPVTRPKFPGNPIGLPAGRPADAPVDVVLAPDYQAPAFTGAVLGTDRLGNLLYRTARLRTYRQASAWEAVRGVETSQRPYLSIAWLYGLELYLALDHAELARGVYHYAPDGHRLTGIDLSVGAVDEIVAACSSQIGNRAPTPASVLLMTSRRARFGWALGSQTHAMALAEAGALTQVLHLVGRESGVAVHPVPLGATEGWQALVDRVWPAEAPVGVCTLDPSVNDR